MPNGKSPGLDEMTAEVLLSCWSFLHIDCMDMIQHFWRIGILAHTTKTGVMKLVSEKVDKRRLKD